MMFLSIKNKILIAHFGIVLAVGLLIGASGYYFVSSQVNGSTTEHLDLMARMMRLRLVDGIAMKKSIVRRISEGREVDYSGPNCQDKNLPFLSYSKSLYFS